MTTTPSLQRLQKENEQLRAEVEHLRDELIRLIGHNLNISERLEDCYDVRRRAQVAREIFSINQERQRNADAGIRKMIAAARAEYVEQSTSSVRPVSVPNNSTDERVYTLSGRQTTETTRGIVIKDGQKVIR